MSPIEDPRNLREVGIFLRSLERTVDAQNTEIIKDIAELKTELAKNSAKKTQYTLIFLSTIVSPCILFLLALVFKNAIPGA